MIRAVLIAGTVLSVNAAQAAEDGKGGKLITEAKQTYEAVCAFLLATPEYANALSNLTATELSIRIDKLETALHEALTKKDDDQIRDLVNRLHHERVILDERIRQLNSEPPKATEHKDVEKHMHFNRVARQAKALMDLALSPNKYEVVQPGIREDLDRLAEDIGQLHTILQITKLGISPDKHASYALELQVLSEGLVNLEKLMMSTPTIASAAFVNLEKDYEKLAAKIRAPIRDLGRTPTPPTPNHPKRELQVFEDWDWPQENYNRGAVKPLENLPEAPKPQQVQLTPPTEAQFRALLGLPPKRPLK